MSGTVKYGSNCGANINPSDTHCVGCGVRISKVAGTSGFPVGPASIPLVPLAGRGEVNTRSGGWLTISFLISFLWLRINGAPVFPLGLVGGLVIGYWSHDINRVLGKGSLFFVLVLRSIVATFIGLIIS